MISRTIRDLASACLRWRPRDDEDLVERAPAALLDVERAPVASPSSGTSILGVKTIATGVAELNPDDVSSARADVSIEAVLRAQVDSLNVLAVELRSVRSRIAQIERSSLLRSPRSTIGIGVVLGLIFLWLLSLLLALVAGLFLLLTGILFGL